MTRAYGLGLLAYLVPTFATGFLWHLVWFHDAYGRLELYRPDVIIPMGFGSMFIQGALYSWMWPKLAPDGPWLGVALRGWLVMSVFAWSYTALPVAAKVQMTSVSGFMALETGFTLFQSALVALGLAWVHRRPI